MASTTIIPAKPCFTSARIIRSVTPISALIPGTVIPVGTLANRELRALRNEAHRCFDQLHRCGLMSKQDAYLWLAALLQVPLSRAHIGYLGAYYCTQVIEESRKLLNRRQEKQRGNARCLERGAAAS